MTDTNSPATAGDATQAASNSASNNTATNNKATWREYLELTKPKVVLLLMVTAIIGMFLATPGMVPLDILVFGSIGMAFAMGASAVVNHVMDKRIDIMMARTFDRPVAQGKIDSQKAIIFAALLSIASLLMLDLLVNRITALLTFFGIVGYAFVYTMYLKRATPQNIVIGGLAGAIPPLLGWTAVTGVAEPHAFLLVLIIFIWTPPHFWALAIARCDEYAKAGIPMLPVTHGIAYTKTQIVLYTWLLLAAGAMPYALQMSGLFYLVVSSVLGFIFLYYAYKLKNDEQNSCAMKTFAYSITYLFALFAALLVDHYL